MYYWLQLDVNKSTCAHGIPMPVQGYDKNVFLTNIDFFDYHAARYEKDHWMMIRLDIENASASESSGVFEH